MRKQYSPVFFIQNDLKEIMEETQNENAKREGKSARGESFYRRDCQKATGKFKQQMQLDMEEALEKIYEERNRMQ